MLASATAAALAARAAVEVSSGPRAHPCAPFRECFQHYVGQDYHYLTFYAKAYSLALTKCTGEHVEHAPIIQGMLDGALRCTSWTQTPPWHLCKDGRSPCCAAGCPRHVRCTRASRMESCCRSGQGTGAARDVCCRVGCGPGGTRRAEHRHQDIHRLPDRDLPLRGGALLVLCGWCWCWCWCCW
jgi:hypothetical protein